MLPVIRANLISAALEALHKTSEYNRASTDPPLSSSTAPPTDAPSPEAALHSDGFIYQTQAGHNGVSLSRPWWEDKGQNVDHLA